MDINTNDVSKKILVAEFLTKCESWKCSNQNFQNFTFMFESFGQKKTRTG